MNDPTTDRPGLDPAIRHFAADWYRKLDVHAPVEELEAMVDPELEMILPEGPLRGREAFRAWYEGVIRIFFDEEHTLGDVEVLEGQASPPELALLVVVRWKASFWTPPEPLSHRLDMIARQRWIIGPGDGGGPPVIRRYIVDALEPQPGSEPLPTA